MIEQTIPNDFLDLADVQARHEEELLSRENVVGVAVGHKWSHGEDTGEPAVTVLVESKFPEGMLRPEDLVPSMLDDVQTDVQEVGIIQAGGPAAPTLLAPPGLELGAIPEAEFTHNGAATAVPAREEELGALLLKNRIRPAMGGYSCGHYRITAGTIATGCYDLAEMPDIPSRYYLLSNNHVLANSNLASIGDPILQPGPYDGGTLPADVIGRLARFVPIKFKTATSTPINYVDAAIAEVDFSMLNREVYWIGYVKKLYTAPTIGTIVEKTGRTTNFTTGRITNINATVDVNYGGGRVARFARQILAQTRDGHAMGAGGDSGSLVANLNEEGVGLLFAGSSLVTVINHLHYVQSLLRIRITET